MSSRPLSWSGWIVLSAFAVAGLIDAGLRHGDGLRALDQSFDDAWFRLGLQGPRPHLWW